VKKVCDKFEEASRTVGSEEKAGVEKDLASKEKNIGK